MTARWLVASPGTGPHVREVALALSEAASLDTVVVPLAAEATGPTHALLRSVSQTARLLARRSIGRIGTSTLRTRAWPELVRVAASRMDRDGRLTDAIWEWTTKDFSRHAARYATAPRSAVYAYETSALELFQAGKRNGLHCVLEVNSCDAEEVMTLHKRLAEDSPESDTPYSRRLRKRAPQRAARRRAEWDLADRVIVNSTATLESMQRAGRDTSKARVVPLGCPNPATSGDEIAGNEPLRVLFVGTFGVRKGAHVLIAALRNLALARPVDVFGRCDLPEGAWDSVRSKLRFMGTIDQARLFEVLPDYDLLVLPTLSEGFGMSISEALAHGVPVLTTNVAGASMLVKDGENGFIVPAGDAASLFERLRSASEAPSRVRAMRPAALISAAAWQWQDFRHALRDALDVAQPK